MTVLIINLLYPKEIIKLDKTYKLVIYKGFLKSNEIIKTHKKVGIITYKILFTEQDLCWYEITGIHDNSIQKDSMFTIKSNYYRTKVLSRMKICGDSVKLVVK